MHSFIYFLQKLDFFCEAYHKKSQFRTSDVLTVCNVPVQISSHNLSSGYMKYNIGDTCGIRRFVVFTDHVTGVREMWINRNNSPKYIRNVSIEGKYCLNLKFFVIFTVTSFGKQTSWTWNYFNGSKLRLFVYWNKATFRAFCKTHGHSETLLYRYYIIIRPIRSTV